MTRITRKFSVTLTAAALAVGALAGPASAFTTTVNQGSTGTWLGAGQAYNTCYGGLRRIDLPDPYVGPAARYPNSYQTIYMQPSLEWSNDGVHWYFYRAGDFVSKTVGPGQHAHLIPPSFSNIPGGYGYRVVMKFWWYVGSSQVGYAVDVFNQGGDYYLVNGAAFYGGCWI